jgi:hypothetical protein
LRANAKTSMLLRLLVVLIWIIVGVVMSGGHPGQTLSAASILVTVTPTPMFASPTPTPFRMFASPTPTPTPPAGEWTLVEDKGGLRTWLWQAEPLVVTDREPEEVATPVIIVIEPTPCPLNLAYVSDVTIPDHTMVGPGERIDKTWRVRNTGPCAVEPGSQLIFLSGAQMNAADSQEVDPIGPGELANITVTMYAPEDPGDHTGVWQMTDAQGEPFGQKLTVVIQVPSPNPPTPTPLPPPPPKQFSAQLVRWWPNCGISLVKGRIVEPDGSPVNGLRVRVWADGWDGSLSLVSGVGLSYGPGEWDVLLRQGQTGKFYATVWDWQTGADSYTRVDSDVLTLDFNVTLENCQPEGDGHQVAEVQFIRNY